MTSGAPLCTTLPQYTSVGGRFATIEAGRETVPMPRLTESKTDILDEAGYAYSEDQIRKNIRERTDGPGWRFYFNSPPSEAVKHELESVLG
jgi:hypothetical protein